MAVVSGATAAKLAFSKGAVKPAPQEASKGAKGSVRHAKPRNKRK